MPSKLTRLLTARAPNLLARARSRACGPRSPISTECQSHQARRGVRGGSRVPLRAPRLMVAPRQAMQRSLSALFLLLFPCLLFADASVRLGRDVTPLAERIALTIDPDKP